MEETDRLKSRLEELRTEQTAWRRVSLRERSACSRRFASLVAEHSRELHATIESPQRTDFRETLSAELLPLAEAASGLSKFASSVLKPRRLSGWGTPMWIGRTKTRVVREPFGVILILGTWNYPLFLTGVQALQSLVAGNAVVVKPALGCENGSAKLRELLGLAGFPQALIEVTDASIETAQAWMSSGIDKAVMTGSSKAGRTVLRSLADRLVPSVMELSGCDAMFLLPSFDLQRVVKSLVFSLRLNGGATCLAPRRVLVPRERVGELEAALRDRLSEIAPTTINPVSFSKVRASLSESGIRMLDPKAGKPGESSAAMEQLEAGRPLVLCDVEPGFPPAQADIFAPLAMLMPYRDVDDALEQNAQCPYALTCSIFGDEAEAERLVDRIRVGTVVINDVIAPTADPRLPFGGVGESGFGVTRGPEGLLEMTFPKVVAARRGNRLLHLDHPRPEDETILEGLLQLLHCRSWKARFAGLRKLIGAAQAAGKRIDTDKKGSKEG